MENRNSLVPESVFESACAPVLSEGESVKRVFRKRHPHPWPLVVFYVPVLAGAVLLCIGEAVKLNSLASPLIILGGLVFVLIQLPFLIGSYRSSKSESSNSAFVLTNKRLMEVEIKQAKTGAAPAVRKLKYLELSDIVAVKAVEGLEESSAILIATDRQKWRIGESAIENPSVLQDLLKRDCPRLKL